MTTEPDDPRPGEAEGRDPSEDATRRHGLSPVVEGRDRGRLPMIAGFLAIMLVVGFLFVTSGKNSEPAPAAKPLPAIAASPGLPAAAPAPPPLPPAPPEAVPAGFPPPPVPGQVQDAGSATAKDDARRHAPMLIYDVSGGSAAPAAAKPSPEDEQAALTAQLLRGSLMNPAATGQEEAKAGSPSEGYADRTLAFAKSASEQSVPEATARRISLDDRIAQGKMLAATLETAVSSDLPGKLRAIVSSDVWSEDGSRRLIRRGSRLIGEYRSGLARGQTRVFVIWTRLLQPDGTDITIGSPGTDDLGRAGLTGTIDRHFAERFGAAVLLSLIGSTTTASQGGSTVIVDTSQGFSQVAQESLQDSVNIPPTITINQGAPVQVFVARDLVFGRASAAAP
ncbi:TrbI/VirB10 family protein [Hydrocarboniphaga sp.]|uniref:TrbI/VirB10 family protein n=1 Tax=Hydrocarboniphaga sp. TaxID=2033016 RepID=UPI002AB80B10|nr:TrbI/VirB10 family protein [Hydrocarboniphaga sp.]MDZ4078506.1 TrbI/VirB10 family protein [Hydrocarboniphaga sp.]